MKRARVWLSLLVAIAAIALACAAVVACTRHEPREDEAAPAIDTQLMAFLSEARALHHQANLKEEGGDLAGATESMQRLVNARRPHADAQKGAKIPEVDEVLADAYARLAELELKRGRIREARAAIESGLAHTPDPTYFKGHLIEVQGLVEEARAAELADAGNGAEAAKAREKAIQLLEEVVRIQDQVIQRSLANKDAAR